MPPFWWNVKQATLLQYDVHEFKTFYSRELFYINVVKIYLQKHYLYNSLMKINIKSSRAKEIIEHIASGSDGHQSFGQLQSTVKQEDQKKIWCIVALITKLALFSESQHQGCWQKIGTNLGMDENNESSKEHLSIFLACQLYSLIYYSRL